MESPDNSCMAWRRVCLCAGGPVAAVQQIPDAGGPRAPAGPGTGRAGRDPGPYPAGHPLEAAHGLGTGCRGPETAQEGPPGCQVGPAGMSDSLAWLPGAYTRSAGLARKSGKGSGAVAWSWRTPFATGSPAWRILRRRRVFTTLFFARDNIFRFWPVYFAGNRCLVFLLPGEQCNRRDETPITKHPGCNELEHHFRRRPPLAPNLPSPNTSPKLHCRPTLSRAQQDRSTG
jgi:hypothetical protein